MLTPITFASLLIPTRLIRIWFYGFLGKLRKSFMLLTEAIREFG